MQVSLSPTQGWVVCWVGWCPHIPVHLELWHVTFLGQRMFVPAVSEGEHTCSRPLVQDRHPLRERGTQRCPEGGGERPPGGGAEGMPMQLQGRQWPLGRGRAWHRPCLRAPGGTASLANPGGETTPRDGAKGSSRTLSYCTNPRAPFPPAAPATPQWPPGAALVKEAGTPGALWVAVPAAWGGQRSWGSHRARGAPPPSHCLHSSCSLRVSVWAKHVSSGSILSI